MRIQLGENSYYAVGGDSGSCKPNILPHATGLQEVNASKISTMSCDHYFARGSSQYVHLQGKDSHYDSSSSIGTGAGTDKLTENTPTPALVRRRSLSSIGERTNVSETCKCDRRRSLRAFCGSNPTSVIPFGIFCDG